MYYRVECTVVTPVQASFENYGTLSGYGGDASRRVIDTLEAFTVQIYQDMIIWRDQSGYYEVLDPTTNDTLTIVHRSTFTNSDIWANRTVVKYYVDDNGHRRLPTASEMKGDLSLPQKVIRSLRPEIIDRLTACGSERVYDEDTHILKSCYNDLRKIFQPFSCWKEMESDQSDSQFRYHMFNVFGVWVSKLFPDWYTEFLERHKEKRLDRVSQIKLLTDELIDHVLQPLEQIVEEPAVAASSEYIHVDERGRNTGFD